MRDWQHRRLAIRNKVAEVTKRVLELESRLDSPPGGLLMAFFVLQRDFEELEVMEREAKKDFGCNPYNDPINQDE